MSSQSSLSNFYRYQTEMHRPDSACLQTVGDPQCSVQVLGVNSSSQAIVCVVSHINHFINVTKLQNRLHRSKDLQQFQTQALNITAHHGSFQNQIQGFFKDFQGPPKALTQSGTFISIPKQVQPKFDILTLSNSNSMMTMMLMIQK